MVENGGGMDVDEGDHSEERAVARPRDVNVVRFAKERVKQIAELLDAIGNTTLVSGEVTKGPRTALQRLPRHMRRRAMSYNVKRLPRAQRRFAASSVALSKHRKKPPSRFFRRRPRNLLLNYVRRQRRFVWLETHIWHAKRFRMAEMWGYKVPLRSCQRAFRPNFRDSMRHCVVQDTSYLRCFQIVAESEDYLVDSLRPLFAPSASATVGFKFARSGQFEVPTLLYEPEQFPRGFIGPARFMWSNCGESRCLLLWTHPSIGDLVLHWLTKLLKVSRRESGESESDRITIPKSLDEWRLRNMQLRIDVYEGNYENKKCGLVDWRDRLIRLSLRGPKSLAILKEVLRTVDGTVSDNGWTANFGVNNEYWNSEACHRSPGEFPEGTVLSALVEDPRLTRPLRKTKPAETRPQSVETVALSTIPEPRSEFWDHELHAKILGEKLSEASLQKMRSDNLAPPRTSDAKIPISMVTRGDRNGSSNTAVGVDLILPSGFGAEFWLALQYGTARAIGLDDQKSLDFEANRLNFPADSPDCAAGRDSLREECDVLTKKYLSRPHNRRVPYWSGLSVKYPFSFEWAELVRSWLDGEGGAEASPHGFYVLRDRRALAAVDLWICGKSALPEKVMEEERFSLVPVQLNVLSTGCARRLALICVPTDNDFNEIDAVTRERRAVRVIEPKRETATKVEQKVAETPKGIFEDFVELTPLHKETLLKLDSLFPDKELLRARKRQAMKKEKRKKAKRQKPSKETSTAERGCVEGTSSVANEGLSMERMEKPSSPDSVSYRKSSSRDVIGRVVRGDYSFSCGKGRAFGYCSLIALQSIRRGIVLVRNATSSHYHPAKISVLRTHPHL